MIKNKKNFQQENPTVQPKTKCIIYFDKENTIEYICDFDFDALWSDMSRAKGIITKISGTQEYVFIPYNSYLVKMIPIE